MRLKGSRRYLQPAELTTGVLGALSVLLATSAAVFPPRIASKHNAALTRAKDASEFLRFPVQIRRLPEAWQSAPQLRNAWDRRDPTRRRACSTGQWQRKTDQLEHRTSFPPKRTAG